MKKFIFSYLPLIVLFSCNLSTNHHDKQETQQITDHSSDSLQIEDDTRKMKIKLFKGKQRLGYNILVKGEKLIHQSNIPAIEGNREFPSKEKARKVAELMRHKIINGIMPLSHQGEIGQFRRSLMFVNWSWLNVPLLQL